MTGNIRIGIIDDHPLFRAGLVTSLQRAPDIEISSTGGTADDAVAAAASGTIDVLLLDIGIPGDGLDAARRITRDHPAVKILFLTGSDSEDTAAQALAVGGKGFVLKGVNGRELVNVIRSIHSGQMYISPELATRMLTGRWRQDPRSSDASARPANRPPLNVREKQILDLATQGLKNREIAVELGLSVATIKHYISLVVRKWGVRNRVEAIVLYSRNERDARQAADLPEETPKP